MRLCAGLYFEAVYRSKGRRPHLWQTAILAGAVHVGLCVGADAMTPPPHTPLRSHLPHPLRPATPSLLAGHLVSGHVKLSSAPHPTRHSLPAGRPPCVWLCE
eukprot:362927-Chlamydomonas_euryale.AAC.16